MYCCQLASSIWAATHNQKREKEDEQAADGHQRSQGGVDETDGREEDDVDSNDVILERRGPCQVADITRRVAEHDPAERNEGEPQQLDDLEEDKETTQREPGKPVGALLNVGALDVLWKVLEHAEDILGRLSTSNILDDVSHEVDNNSKDREQDQIPHDHEEVVSGEGGAVQATPRLCTLVLADAAQDVGQDEREDGEDRGRQQTGYDSERPVRELGGVTPLSKKSHPFRPKRQVAENRDEQHRNRVCQTNETNEYPAEVACSDELGSVLRQVLPDDVARLRCELKMSSAHLLSLARIDAGDAVRFRDRLECHEAVCLALDALFDLVGRLEGHLAGLAFPSQQGVNVLAFGVNLVTEELDLVGQIIDLVDLLATKACPASLSEQRALRGHLAVLQVLHEGLLEVSHSLIVILYQLRKVPEPAADGRTVNFIRDLDAVNLEAAHQVHEALV